ncbi:unnamed protein product [Brassica rapa subsp. trilocularis]
MKLKTIEGEDSNTYQGLANATKAGMHETPHDALNRIPKRANTRFNRLRNLQKDGLYPSPQPEKKSQNQRKKASYTTARGTRPTPRCPDVSMDKTLTQRRLMTPENRLSI